MKWMRRGTALVLAFLLSVAVLAAGGGESLVTLSVLRKEYLDTVSEKARPDTPCPAFHAACRPIRRLPPPATTHRCGESRFDRQTPRGKRPGHPPQQPGETGLAGQAVGKGQLERAAGKKSTEQNGISFPMTSIRVNCFFQFIPKNQIHGRANREKQPLPAGFTWNTTIFIITAATGKNKTRRQLFKLCSENPPPHFRSGKPRVSGNFIFCSHFF